MNDGTGLLDEERKRWRDEEMILFLSQFTHAICCWMFSYMYIKTKNARLVGGRQMGSRESWIWGWWGCLGHGCVSSIRDQSNKLLHTAIFAEGSIENSALSSELNNKKGHRPEWIITIIIIKSSSLSSLDYSLTPYQLSSCPDSFNFYSLFLHPTNKVFCLAVGKFVRDVEENNRKKSI